MCSHRGCGQVPSAFPTQLGKCSSVLLCSSPAVPGPGSHTALAAAGCAGPRHRSGSFCASSPRHIHPAATWVGSQPAEATVGTDRGGENVCYSHRAPFGLSLRLLRRSQASCKRKPQRAARWGWDGHPVGSRRDSRSPLPAHSRFDLLSDLDLNWVLIKVKNNFTWKNPIV